LSAFFATSAAISARNLANRSANRASPVARIWQASKAAFWAPSIATVATGTPGGICTVASRASCPRNGPLLMGSPITGTVVWAAKKPARWAAPPAAAITTLIPRSRTPAANSATSCGVRWADAIVTSHGTCIASSNSAAFAATGKSESLPITIKTAGLSNSFPPRSTYSHSMVPGGFDVTSYTSRFTSGTSFTTRFEIRSSTS
jgi:hypothetical protein